jgi:hypothetical protein
MAAYWPNKSVGVTIRKYPIYVYLYNALREMPNGAAQ